MSYTVAITDTSVFGDHRVIFGTYTKLTGDTSGSFTLGLSAVTNITINSNTAAVAAGASWASGNLTFYGASGDTGGYWMVIGY